MMRRRHRAVISGREGSARTTHNLGWSQERYSHRRENDRQIPKITGVSARWPGEEKVERANMACRSSTPSLMGGAREKKVEGMLLVGR